MRDSAPLALALLAVIASALVAGCDTSVDPLDEKSGLYSIYGHLDIDNDVNYIRVKDINTPFQKDSSRSLNAEVTLTNRETGASETLPDSTVLLDGIYTHNFKTTLEIEPGTEYRLNVKSPDGSVVQTTATTPEIANVDVTPRSASCQTIINLIFTSVATPRHLDVSVGVEYDDEKFWAPLAPGPIPDAETSVAVRFSPQGVLDRIFRNIGDVVDDVHPVRCSDLDSDVFRIQYTHYGPDFYEDIVGDDLGAPEGIGRFGGLYRDSLHYRVNIPALQ